MSRKQIDSARQSQKAPVVLPRNASWHSIGGVDGWLYSVFDPYGEHYVFFLWNDDENFAVSLVDPPLELEPEAGTMKLQADGRLGPFGPNKPVTVIMAFQMSLAWIACRAIQQRITAARNE